MKKAYIELIIRVLSLIGLIAVLVFALKGMLGGVKMHKQKLIKDGKNKIEKGLGI